MRAALIIFLLLLALPLKSRAQFATGPVPVGVVTVTDRPIAQDAQYVGRIEAVNKVAIVARVTGVLEQFYFTEGAEVNKGDKLYLLEQGPYQADLASKQAQVAQYDAQLHNAKLTLGRQRSLLFSPAGQQSNVDSATAAQLQLQAEEQGAEADVQASAINLGYTEITAPISGRISRTAITPGNVVGPTSGTLTTIVSQDPMYLTFSVPVRAAMGISFRDPPHISITLPDGSTYGPAAKLDFFDNSVTANTDTILMRAVIPNAKQANGNRPLVDGEFVTVSLEQAGAPSVPAVPRTAILEDQEGSYVFVVTGGVAHIRRITVGDTNGAWAAVTQGVAPGDQVVVEGLQKITDGAKVSPSPAAPIEG